MTDFLTRAADRIKSDEGLKLKPYPDHLGNLTIGYGTLLEDITEEFAAYMFDFHFKKALEELRKNFSWFEGAPIGITDALLNLHFNLGLPRLKGFKKMLKAMEAGDYEKAADELLDSLYHKQVPNRAERNASMIRSANT